MARLAHGSSIGPFPYRILDQVGQGEGGMSHLYKATIGKVEQIRTSDLVVLKIVNIENNPEFHRETMDNEVETLRRLGTPGHRGIVKLFPVEGEHIRARSVYTAQTTLPGTPWFFVMEYLAGGSIADLVKRRKKMEIGAALHLTIAVLEILEYTHQQGFVHLDIKPENLMFRQPVSDSLDVVLVDFGIARGPGQFGLEAGTVNWSPPERIASTVRQIIPPENAPPPHPSMDVYAVGLLLYFMVTGRMPFTGRSRERVTTAILEGNPTIASRYEPLVNPELDRLILNALSKNPASRPTTRDFILRVRSLQNKYPFEFRPGVLGEKGKSGREGNRKFSIPWVWLAVLGIVVIMATVLFFPGLGAGSNTPVSPTIPSATEVGGINATPDSGEEAGAPLSATATMSATPRATTQPTRTRTVSTVTVTVESNPTVLPTSTRVRTSTPIGTPGTPTPRGTP
jgi:serine/threonine protein kinase